MLIFAAVPGGSRGVKHNTCHHNYYTCVQTASVVNQSMNQSIQRQNAVLFLWRCKLVKLWHCHNLQWQTMLVVTCENVSHGHRSRSRDGSILSVSSILSIIVAFTGRVYWFSFIAVILRHGRKNQRTLCNLSIWTVADVGLGYTRKPCYGRETARCCCKIWYLGLSKLTAALVFPKSCIKKTPSLL